MEKENLQTIWVLKEVRLTDRLNNQNKPIEEQHVVAVFSDPDIGRSYLESLNAKKPDNIKQYFFHMRQITQKVFESEYANVLTQSTISDNQTANEPDQAVK